MTSLNDKLLKIRQGCRETSRPFQLSLNIQTIKRDSIQLSQPLYKQGKEIELDKNITLEECTESIISSGFVNTGNVVYKSASYDVSY